MNLLAESLRRLFRDKKAGKAQIERLLKKKTITQKEFDYIVSDKTEAPSTDE